MILRCPGGASKPFPQSAVAAVVPHLLFWSCSVPKETEACGFMSSSLESVKTFVSQFLYVLLDVL